MLGHPVHVLKDASNNVNQIPWSQSTSRHIYHNITYKMSRIAKINSATSIALVTGDIKDCMIPASWRKAPWAQWRWIHVQAPAASDPVRICIGACRVGNLEWNAWLFKNMTRERALPHPLVISHTICARGHNTLRSLQDTHHPIVLLAQNIEYVNYIKC